MLQRKSIGEHFSDSPGSSTVREEPICSTPPHAAYRSSNHNTPEIDFGRQSPLFMSMSQRAIKLGVDVTWASSPTRRSSSPLIDRKMPTPPSGLYQASPTMIMHRRSFKERRPTQLNDSPPKNGLIKFQEELRSIMPLLKKKQSDDSGVDIPHSDQTLSSANDSVFSMDTQTIPNTHKRAGSLNNQVPCKIARSEERVSDYLSKSIQQEFLDDSDLDMELFKSSQEVEARLKEAETTKLTTIANKSTLQQQQQHNSDLSHFFNESFPDNITIEEIMSSKELDDLISSQTLIKKPPIERHKSMPPKRVSEKTVSKVAENIFLSSSSSPMPNTVREKGGTIKRNTSLGRHNSMPASPSAPFMRQTFATKRRLLKSFKASGSGIGSSEESD